MVRVAWLRWDRESPGALPPPLHALLTAEEQGRLARLLVEPARKELVVGRALLRVAIAGATGAPISAVCLEVRDGGRPTVSAPAGAPSVNLSHCPGLLAVALCDDGVVGVDVEAATPRRPGLIRRFFHPDEAAWVEGGPDGTLWQRFTDIWTLKEAVVKAHGGGLAVPLPSFSVAGPEGPSGATHVDGAGPLSLSLLHPTGGHALSIAVTGGGPARVVATEVTLDELARDAALDKATRSY